MRNMGCKSFLNYIRVIQNDIYSSSSRLINAQHITARSFHTIKDGDKYSWSILKHIYQKQFHNLKYACFLLNISNDSFEHFEKYKYIWDEANLKVAVNGSANCLDKRKLIHTADIVCGDFDSVNSKLIQKLRCPNEATRMQLAKESQISQTSKVKMPQVIETPNQKETDFTKAVRVVSSVKPNIDNFIALYRGDGSRIDHLFGLINTLHLFKKNIILINIKSDTISWLLYPGLNIIEKSVGRELCSLVPFTGVAEVETEGLEYNAKPDKPLSFANSISTSNICLGNSKEITVKTDREILWSIDI